MLKNIAALVSSVALFLVFTGWPKRADAEERKWSVALNAPISSKYIWRGSNVVDDWVFQPSATLLTRFQICGSSGILQPSPWI